MPTSEYYQELIVQRTLLDKELFPVLSLSLHDGDSGRDGQNEIGGGGYTRQEVQFMPVVGGTITNRNRIDFEDIPLNLNITHFGIWSEDRYIMGGPWTLVERQRDLRVRPGELTIAMGG